MSNSSIHHATSYGFMQFCGESFSDTCSIIEDVGSKTASLALNFIARTLMIFLSLLRLLICRGELKTTCDTIVTFGLKAGDAMAYFYEHGSVFARENAIPSLIQAIDVAKDFVRINVTPTLMQGLNVTRGYMNQAILSVLQKSFIAIERSRTWLDATYQEGLLHVRITIELTANRTKNIDLTNLRKLSVEDLLRKIEIGFTSIDRKGLTQAVGALVFIYMIIKLIRSIKNPAEKRKFKSRTKSLATQTESGFLNLEDDLEDEGDFTRDPINRDGLRDFLDDTFPALSRNRDEAYKMDGSMPLPPLKGPAVTSWTFHVHAPPTIEKEIPKVDLVGTLQFVKTGKVRTFVHKGSRRLLVVNFQNMTMELYVPKPSDAMSKSPIDQKAKKGSRNKNKASERHSGIHLMSTRNIMDMEDDVSSDEEEENDEKAWDKNNFNSKPAVIVKLSDLISVSAATQNHSSVLEVSYKAATAKMNNPKTNPESIGSTISRVTTPQESCNNDEETLAESYAEDIHSMVDSSISQDCIENSRKAKSHERRREFAFLSDRDAAEFQHIITSLRTSGVSMSQLYEMLEELHVNSDAYYPEISPSLHVIKRPKDTEDFNSLEAVQFRAAGVALDDAWRCMHEIPFLREGLLQYHHQAYSKFTSKHDNMIATAAANGSYEEEISGDKKTNYRKKLAEFYGSKRCIIGIVDFIFLFVNMLPPTAVPYRTPCGACEDDMGSDAKDGIRVHHQCLRNTLLLQQLVGRASVHVVAYCKAKLVVQDGWHLMPQKPSSDELKNQDNSEDSAQIQANLRRLAFDDDRDNWTYDVEHRNEYYEATVGKDVSSMMHGDSSSYQGFSSVGMHLFRLPKPTKKSSRDTSPEDDWLNPRVDPVEYLPR